MKVIIVVPDLPIQLDNIKGGVHSALLNLLKGFTTQPISVRVISITRNVSTKTIVCFSNLIDIYYLPEGRMPHVFNYLFTCSTLLKKEIKNFNPSIVHFTMSGYILLTKVFGLLGKTPLVTIHGLGFPEARLKTKLKDKLVFYSNGIIEKLLNPNNIIHLSNYTLQIIGKTKNYAIIPNAIDTSYFTITPKLHTQNKLLYVGVIDENKNLLYLLQALKIATQNNQYFTVDILGDYINTEYKLIIEKYIADNNLQAYITFHGWVTQPTVKHILQQSDILIVSSKQESLPMVIAEAMCAGKVVASSNVGGVYQMITNQKDGFIFENNHPQNLAIILQQLYNNNALIQQIQTQAKSTGKAMYNSTIVAEKTIAFYNKILKK
jgi:glycosyltransferase involved in cell wall biosynthesis